jgi:hypothetical protein
MAKAFRDDQRRLNELDKSFGPSAHGGPITPVEEEEERLRVSLVERARAVVLPSGYGALEERRDWDRLGKLHSKRMTPISCGGGLTDAEDAEDAQLTVRVAAYSESPEARGRLRLDELELRAQLDELERKIREPSLTPAERQELDDLRNRYPPLPPYPSTQGFEELMEAAERTRQEAGISDAERDASKAKVVALILKHWHGYERD